MTEEIQNTLSGSVENPDQTQFASAAYEVKVVAGEVHVFIKSDHDVAAIMKLSPNAALYFGNDVTRASEEARKFVAPSEGATGPSGTK
jgi:hypothetical protein